MLLPIILFYFCAFWGGFLLCIPIGPVNLEVFHAALKKHHVHAMFIAIGAGIGDGIWALVAFMGVSPFLKSILLQGIFLAVTTVITFILGVLALKDARYIEKKEENIVKTIKRKRWALLKGLSLVLINPLGIVSWLIIFQVLFKFNLTIPYKLNYEIFFFVIVFSGAISYFSLIVFITHKMKSIFNPERTVKITKFLGYLLIVFSVYFLFNAIQSLFFNVNHFK
jgi:threonine/homoserine/homoserine lactone efflux protein